ncbi:MAG: multi-copper polyphenol oxidoreductase [Rhodocyclales bacterium RIFCSPLOWO2_02_FULL_63_24]|nr:MAG: multi-copper polyphenol oxidoreductase [Rhodocyclales bacterium RIFCSPLOWO2_02_FULL_63_24]
MSVSLILPDWPAPPGVRALATTRQGGASRAPWQSFNLGDHVGDDPRAVAANRALLRRELPAEPLWLTQVHGARCVDAAGAVPGTEADASFTRQRGVVCAVLTADCLPVLLCDEQATVVAIAHAGWRGLAAGVIEATVGAMAVPGERLLAWLGPAIGAQAFEVGGEVRDVFAAHDPRAASAFAANPQGKWLCDIYELARLRLDALGIRRVAGPRSGIPGMQSPSADSCTVSETEQFFSYRRDGITGRMASLIWLE